LREREVVINLLLMGRIYLQLVKMGKKKAVQLSRNKLEVLKVRIARILCWSDYLARMSLDDACRPKMTTLMDYKFDAMKLVSEFNELFKDLGIELRMNHI